jgi:hypothetical protein
MSEVERPECLPCGRNARTADWHDMAVSGMTALGQGPWKAAIRKTSLAPLVAWPPLLEGLRANTHNRAAYLASRLLVAEEWAGRRAFAMTQ